MLRKPDTAQHSLVVDDCDAIPLPDLDRDRDWTVAQGLVALFESMVRLDPGFSAACM